MSALAAAAIGAGISAIGGLLASNAQNSANASLDAETRAWQEKMWHLNNAYNTPSAQRDRLEAAGINPALAFQGGNTGVASSAPNAVNHTPADFSAMGSGFAGAGQMALQAQNLDAQNDLIRSQAAAQKIDNLTLMERKLAELSNLKADADKKGEDTKWISWQIDKDMALYDAYRKQAYADIERIQSESALNNANTALSLGRDSREQAQLSHVIEQLQSIAKSNNSMALLNSRNAGLIPRLSKSQLNQVADAFVEEKLKNASAEEIAGFRFSGATIEKIKQAVIKFLIGN